MDYNHINWILNLSEALTLEGRIKGKVISLQPSLNYYGSTYGYGDGEEPPTH